MMPRHAATATALGALLAAGAPDRDARPPTWDARPVRAASPPSPELAVWRDGAWTPWWRAASAPARWSAALPTVADAVAWRTIEPGLEWGTLRLSGEGEAWRLGVVLVRIDPRRHRVRLHAVRDGAGRVQPWSVDAAPPDAQVAFNAGQFGLTGPWGWLVMDGEERRPPGVGPLSMAFVVDTAGRARLVPADGIAAVRGRGAAEAFQSYPVLLAGGGEVPEPLRVSGRGVDHTHRDARLALGTLRDGRLLVALTRFEGLGGMLQELPFGPTTPEMSAVMGALGCDRAMMLDGGISAQLLVRERDGRGHRWRGLRKVPVGLAVVPHAAPDSGGP